MQVRAGHSSRSSDESNLLSPHDRVAYRHKRLAEMEVCGDDSTTVVDVNDVTGEKEVVDERNHSAVRRAHGLSDSAPEIDAEVAADHTAVKETAGSEFARDH